MRWVGREGWQLTWWWSYLCRGSQIVVARGPAGSWDAGGIASPGAAAAADGTVILGYAAENSPSGGINRGIGVAIAKHPLGPFVKQTTPIASPHTICGGTGRCDDVIMQTRPDGVHLYHSVKGSNVAPGSGIRHRMTTNGGKSWSESKMVLSTHMQPSTDPAGVDSSPASPPRSLSLRSICSIHINNIKICNVWRSPWSPGSDSTRWRQRPSLGSTSRRCLGARGGWC
eukprot:COSAG01_NODE_1313_length_10770_cov_14.047887_7_plen_228_part_00